MQPEPIEQNGSTNSVIVGKVEQLTVSPKPEEIIPPQYTAINPAAVSFLYARSPRPAPEGEKNRKTLTFTITPQTDEQWRDFLQTNTGTLPVRGKGISSPMVELAMQLLMAVVADFKTAEVASRLLEIVSSDEARDNIVTNFSKVSTFLLDPQS